MVQLCFYCNRPSSNHTIADNIFIIADNCTDTNPGFVANLDICSECCTHCYMVFPRAEPTSPNSRNHSILSAQGHEVMQSITYNLPTSKYMTREATRSQNDPSQISTISAINKLPPRDSSPWRRTSENPENPCFWDFLSRQYRRYSRKKKPSKYLRIYL